MSKAEILFDAVTNVREELIEEALNYRFRRRRGTGRYGPWLALAACLVIALGLGWVWFGGIGMGGNAGNTASDGAAWEQDNQETEKSGNAAPQAPEAAAGGDNSAGAEVSDSNSGGSESALRLEALVLEAREDGLLVEVTDGEEGLLFQVVLLPAEGIADGERFAAGDALEVIWDGGIDWEAEVPALQGALTVLPLA